MTVHVAATEDELRTCYQVMRELRPHLDEASFVAAVDRMRNEDGYTLAFLEHDGAVVSAAGFHLRRALFCDRYLYVDDLVTLASERSKGYGAALLEWLKERAHAEGCTELHLDSGFHRIDAHRFYDRHAVPASGFHFRARLT
jgi:GNAT superfamily N-acetyltransferase